MRVWGEATNGVQGQTPYSGVEGDFDSLKLMTFSYFIDYFLNKIIREMGRFRQIFFFFVEGEPKSMAKLDGRAMAGFPYGSAPNWSPLQLLTLFLLEFVFQ